MFRRAQGEPQRFKRYTTGSLRSRLIVAVTCVLLGIVSLIVGLIVRTHGVFTWLDFGIILIVYGVVGFVVGLYVHGKDR